MNKKVIFGTALFIVVGLFMFTFANPNDKVSKDKSSKQTVTSVSEEKTSTEEPKKEEETKKEEVVNNQTTTTTTARRTTRRTITTPVTNPVTTPVVPQTPAQEVTNTEEPKEDPAVIAQKEAEEKAKKEAEELANYKEAAKKELAEYKKDENYSDKNTEAVATIKADGSDAIDAAKTKDEVDQEKDAAKALIDALDTEAPVLTIADDEVVYQKVGKANLNNYTVTDNVSSKDKIVVTISVTKDGRKVNEVNYNSVGTYAVSYTATDEAGNEAKAVLNIKVKAVKAESLVLIADGEDVTNVTDSYWVNDPVKTISVYVKYNNGSTKKLSKMNCNTALFICIGDYTETGILSTAHETFSTATVTYSYKGLTAKYNYNVKAKKVISLTVTGNKAEYFQNEAFGITVTAKWNDNTEEVVTNYRIAGNTKNVGKNQTALISYGGSVTSFKYNVIARQITSLVVTLNKDTYIAGQNLDIKSVVAKWNDGSEEVVNGYTVNANTNKIGNHTGYVSYKGINGEFSYKVIPRRVLSLEVTGNKATYIQNEAFGITVTAKWNDNTEEVVTNYSISNNTKIVKNHQTAVVSYGGATTSFTYDVIARRITSLQVTLNKDTYVKGQKLDIKSVVAKWNDGSEETITKYTVTGNTNVVANNQKGYVIYNGIIGEFKYNVIEKKIVSISVTSPSNDYIKGDKFNLTVKAKWNDGSEEVVNNYSVSGNTNTVGLDQTATISYKGVSTTYTYDVKYELHLVHPWFSADYYLEFKDNVAVASIVYYNKNGGHSAVPLTRMQGKKIYINPTIYAVLHNMDGTNSNEKLVVTVYENGKQVSYTYTKTIND